MRSLAIFSAAVIGFGLGAFVGGSMDVLYAAATDASMTPIVAIGLGLISGTCLGWLVARLVPRGPRSQRRAERGKDLMRRFGREGGS
jgi:hypothetical protein